ncbi:MAG: PIN domain protein [Bacteroidota bacterium]
MKFYIDTSVFGGVFDDEFKAHTVPFFEYIQQNRYTILYSDVCQKEISEAPSKVQNLVDSLEHIEIVCLNKEMSALAELYIKEGTLRPQDINDAEHIAIATVASASALISWNFKHMVNFFKIKQYNAINLREGYRMINIHSPKEAYE